MTALDTASCRADPTRVKNGQIKGDDLQSEFLERLASGWLEKRWRAYRGIARVTLIINYYTGVSEVLK